MRNVLVLSAFAWLGLPSVAASAGSTPGDDDLSLFASDQLGSLIDVLDSRPA